MRIPRYRPLAAPLSRVRRWLSALQSEKPLVSYLVTLPLAGGLPILLFSALLIYQLQVAHEESAQLTVARQAQELQLAIDRDIKNGIQILQILAKSHALSQANFRSFFGECVEAAARAGGRVHLIEPLTFQQIFVTLAPYGTELPPTAASDTVHQVTVTGTPQVSGVFKGNISRQWVYVMAIPIVATGGEVSHVLMLSFETRHILQILSEQALVTSGEAVVVDASSRIVAGSGDSEGLVGNFLPADWPNGGGIITAEAPARTAGWRVVVATPLSALLQPYRQTWSRLLIIGAGVLFLSIVLAIHFGRIITRPAHLLADAAAALGRGEIVASEKTSILEVNRVGEALTEASRQISDGRAIEAHLAIVLRASGEAIYSLSSNELIETWNPAAERLFGYTADEIIGQPIDVLVPEENRIERAETFLRARKGESTTFETRRRRKDGECFAAAITVAPLECDEGGFVSVARDISQRKANEERITFLLHELSHRTKNLLAVVQSIARQTARSSPTLDAFQDRFGARLLALAATHDALVSQNWYGASVRQVVAGQVAAIMPDADGRISAVGPDFLLKPGVAESLGMALHELAVNAIKYGVFVSEFGRVHIGWDMDTTAATPSFTMNWIEQGGPAVEEPAMTGFGYAVMKDALERRTNGRVVINFAAEGLRWTFEAPIENVLTSGKPRSASPPRGGGAERRLLQH